MDDGSSALIAKLLAEDQQYALAAGLYDEPLSDDGETKRKRRKKTKASSRAKPKPAADAKSASKPRTAPQSTASAQNSDAAAPEGEASKKRATPRRWTAEEEARFLDGLERFGRDWQQIAEHVGTTRKARDVASHAQKHFIKLYKESLPLPAKVCESGDGYTLSGKPLDPDSAAARAYGVKGSDATKEYRMANEAKRHSSSNSSSNNNNNQGSPPVCDGPGPDGPAAPGAPDAEHSAASASPDGAGPAEASKDGSKAATAAKKRRETLAERERKAALKLREAWERKQAKRQNLYGSDGRTDYSRNRSRRRAATRFVTNPSEALDFVSVSSYVGPPASGPKSQPFLVKVCSSVYATVDLHAHMSTAEVMGFLAGRFDPNKLTITVEKAFPGSSTLNGATECEMDPVVEVNLRAEITGVGLSVVGWYHSHPTFQPVPSQCDVENQANYQALFRDESCGMEPFLGLILSPFDPELPSPRSQHGWFYVEAPQVLKAPKRIEADLVCEASLAADTVERMLALVRDGAARAATGCDHAVDFAAVWRTDKDNNDLSMLGKLRASLAFSLAPLVYTLASHGADAEAVQTAPPDHESADAVLDNVLAGLQL